jgi:hypothetical protein
VYRKIKAKRLARISRGKSLGKPVTPRGATRAPDAAIDGDVNEEATGKENNPLAVINPFETKKGIARTPIKTAPLASSLGVSTRRTPVKTAAVVVVQEVEAQVKAAAAPEAAAVTAPVVEPVAAAPVVAVPAVTPRKTQPKSPRVRRTPVKTVEVGDGEQFLIPPQPTRRLMRTPPPEPTISRLVVAQPVVVEPVEVPSQEVREPEVTAAPLSHTSPAPHTSPAHTSPVAPAAAAAAAAEPEEVFETVPEPVASFLEQADLDYDDLPAAADDDLGQDEAPIFSPPRLISAPAAVTLSPPITTAIKHQPVYTAEDLQYLEERRLAEQRAQLTAQIAQATKALRVAQQQNEQLVYRDERLAEEVGALVKLRDEAERALQGVLPADVLRRGPLLERLQQAARAMRVRVEQGKETARALQVAADSKTSEVDMALKASHAEHAAVLARLRQHEESLEAIKAQFAARMEKVERGSAEAIKAAQAEVQAYLDAVRAARERLRQEEALEAQPKSAAPSAATSNLPRDQRLLHRVELYIQRHHLLTSL